MNDKARFICSKCQKEMKIISSVRKGFDGDLIIELSYCNCWTEGQRLKSSVKYLLSKYAKKVCE